MKDVEKIVLNIKTAGDDIDENIIIRPGDTLLAEDFSASWIGNRMQLKREQGKSENWKPYPFCFIWTHTTKRNCMAKLVEGTGDQLVYRLGKRINRRGKEKVSVSAYMKNAQIEKINKGCEGKYRIRLEEKGLEGEGNKPIDEDRLKTME